MAFAVMEVRNLILGLILAETELYLMQTLSDYNLKKKKAVLAQINQ